MIPQIMKNLGRDNQGEINCSKSQTDHNAHIGFVKMDMLKSVYEGRLQV